MKIDLKKPKYVMPLLALPFLCLFFYVYHSSAAKNTPQTSIAPGLNSSVGSVSSDVRKKDLAGKLDAYRNAYKGTDGLTAVNIIPKEQSSNATFKDNYSDKEKRTLDSIEQAMKAKYNPVPADPGKGPPVYIPAPRQHAASAGHLSEDDALAKAIAGMGKKQRSTPVHAAGAESAQRDPMDVFKQQMAYMDSIQKQNDPAYKAEKAKRTLAEKVAREQAGALKFTVTKAGEAPGDFNTVKPPSTDNFIMAAIDENVTGYAGSRLKIRLLEDIRAGNTLIKKGTCVYALINGFSEQRVTLVVNSVISEGRILPVKLDVYDLDGMPGLYVPSSAFRDFTKDFGGNSVQGVTIEGGSTGSQFLMSSVDKLFQSTSSAIAGVIRKNKAKLKYNSYIYLIDKDALQNAQRAY